MNGRSHLRRPLWALAALLVFDVATLFAGRKAPTESGPPRARVGLVFDVGGRGDRSFNDGAYRGLVRAGRRLGVEVEYIEPGDGSDRESAIRILAARGFDLVIGVGFIFSSDMTAIAREYPRVKFACVDYVPAPRMPQNLVGLKFREEEGAFLVGAAAGLVSKTKTVGFVGGMEIPLIRRFEAGYRAGVREVCPVCKVLAAYAGQTPLAFKDPVKGAASLRAKSGAAPTSSSMRPARPGSASSASRESEASRRSESTPISGPTASCPAPGADRSR
jgi:basic membrane protein A